MKDAHIGNIIIRYISRPAMLMILCFFIATVAENMDDKFDGNLMISISSVCLTMLCINLAIFIFGVCRVFITYFKQRKEEK